MPIDYVIFTEKWLERAERRKEKVDEADCFISLWISFNGWLKWKFGEIESDRRLIERAKKDKILQSIFSKLNKESSDFGKNLKKLGSYSVADMRDSDNANKLKKYDGSFSSLLDTIYQIRCNLFHGRKDPEEDRKDFELICLAKDILLPLFKNFLES